MKLKKLLTIFLIIVICTLQFSFIQFFNFVYAQDNQTNIAKRQNDSKFHYTQLTKEGKSIYDAMYTMYSQGILKTGTQDYNLADNGYVTQEQLKSYLKGNKELSTAMNAARYAFYADYPEIFYVDFQKLTLRVTQDNQTKAYNAYIGSGRNENYYTEGFTSKEQVEMAIQEFDTRVNQIAQGAKNLPIEEGQNRQVEQIKYVHNEIINNTSYRLEDECYEGNEGFLGTPYGILVKKQGVCEGYARALKTILDKLEITSILVQGTHQYSGEVAVAHMWNYVQIDVEEPQARQVTKKWYAIDCTQDDPYLYVIQQSEWNEYTNNFANYGKDNYENTKYLLVGQLTMSERHLANPVIEAAGDYEFEYPQLEDDDFGTNNTENSDGLSVKYKPNATTNSEGVTSSLYTISYRAMGAEAAAKQGIYMLIRYHVYDEQKDAYQVSPWCYILKDVYAIDDYPDHLDIYETSAKYVEFAVTDVKPGDYASDISNLSYKGTEKGLLARTDKLYNENHGYIAPPYVQNQIPTQRSSIYIREKPYHVKVTWDEDLVLEDGVSQENIGANIKCESAMGEGISGEEYSKVENITWDGNRTVEFDITFSQMYADNYIHYNIYITGLIGKKSKKTPNPVSYVPQYRTECYTKQALKGSWDLFAKPTLMENKDLSMQDWKTSNGIPVSDKLKDRVALVTTKTTKAQTEKMQQLMEETFPDEEIVTSETYNITLTVCKAAVVSTGHKVTMRVGFPEGYGPESEGITFKAYHFKKDASGEVTGVEEIDCIVTQYGLIITCDSFSPFAIAVVDGVEENATKTVILSSSEGGQILVVDEEDGDVVTLRENESKTLNIRPNDGYEIENITVCGNVIEVTDKDMMNITVNYDDIKDGNCIVDANFIAKTVVKKDEQRGEVSLVQEAVPAVITSMPEIITASLNSNVTITPQVQEPSEGVTTYQWYKNDEILNGKTNKTLTIESVTQEDLGDYTLTVTTTVGAVSKQTSKTCKVTLRSFETSITSSEETMDLTNLNPGDEFEISLNINNFVNIEKGLNIIGGQLEYDTNILNIVPVEGNNSIGQNGWNAETFNNENFKFVTDNDEFIKEGGEVFRIRFKVNENIEEAKQTSIKVKNIVGANGDGDIFANDAVLDINIQKPEKAEGITSNVYTIEKDFISRIVLNTTVSVFKENVTTEQELVFIDKDGNILGEDSILATGMTIKVGDNLQYTLVVTGDIDGNGRLGTNDLSKLKLHYIEYELLTGASLKAADLDNNGKVSINDLSQLKLELIK